MRRVARLVLVITILGSLVSGCIPLLGAKEPTVVNVAFIAFPGGGASPATLTLYKAALDVTKRHRDDFELNVTTITPTMPEPGVMTSPTENPMVSALEQALSQNPPPDVVLFSSGYELSAAIERDLLVPLDDLARGEGSLKLDDYYPGPLEAVRDQGKLYALPLSATPLLLQYDKRVFDASGLMPPDSSWNWSTLLSASKQLTKPDVDGAPQYGLGSLDPNWLFALIWQNGGELFSADGRRSLVAEPPAVEAIQFYYDLQHTHKLLPVPPTTKEEAIRMSGRVRAIEPGEYPPLSAMGLGRAAMQFSHFGSGSIYGMQRMGSGERPIRLAELPGGKSAASFVQIESALALTSASANPKVAFRALTALAAEIQPQVAAPVTRSAAKRLGQAVPGLSEEDARAVASAMEHSRSLPAYRQIYYQRVLWEKLANPIQEGKRPPAEIASDAAQALDEILNKSLEELQKEQQGGMGLSPGSGGTVAARSAAGG